MAISITIDNLDSEVLEFLQAEARRRGVDVGVVVNDLLKDRLPCGRSPSNDRSHHDLDSLAGTWSAGEARRFLEAIADFGQVDEDLWK